MVELSPGLAVGNPLIYMYSNRRSFLRVGSVLLCGGLLRPQSLFAFSEKTRGVLSFDATELKLLDFVSSYSSTVRLTGASVLGHFQPESSCGLRVLAEVTDFPKLADALLRAPFKSFYAKANAVSFVAQGSGHVVENLTAGEFASRLAALSSKEKIVFAHDALSYDPVAKQLDDPLGSLDAGELKLINPPKKTPEALEVAMRGTGDARAAAVPEGEAFAKWKAQLVKSQAHAKAAYPIAAAFVRGLPAFAALAGSDDVKSALATPLISSSVKSALGMTAKQAIGEFDRVREIFGQSYSDGAVWLYVVLGKQVKKDTRGWIDGALLEDVHWRAAFDDASKIEQAFQSPELKSQA
ncbi:MAG TPA: hypothetical protein VEX43_09190 [Chthoniobacterales bacterium]|nr:hypothetical protein [Chthoniobacterales bacterium]